MAMKLISEGAEAKIFSTRLLGIDAVVKRRVRKGYRLRLLDEAIRSSRTKTEAKVIGLATTNGVNAPTLLLVDGCDLYMTRIYGRRLGPAPTRHESKELGSALALLHNAGIAHGDFTPANALHGTDGRIYIIDFGLSEITMSVEERALDLLLMKRAINTRAFGELLGSYRKSSKTHVGVMARLAEIERRGRYQTRTLSDSTSE